MLFLALRVISTILIKKSLAEKRMALEYDVAAFSVQGKRERMEDAYFLDPAKGLFIVADGVGGSEHGDEASKLAIDITVETLGKREMPIDPLHLERTLKQTVAVTQSAVRARFGDGRKGSTTLTLLFVTDLHLGYCHVGDSRLYVVKAPLVNLPPWRRRSASTPLLFQQLTKDDNYFVGNEKPIFDSGMYPLTSGDCGFLVCTDGLYKHLQEWEWVESKMAYEHLPLGESVGKMNWKKKAGQAILQYERSPPEEVDLLKQSCADAYDNVTALYALFRQVQVPLTNGQSL